MDLMAVAVGCKVEGPVVGDAARRVRVKPLSRPQTKLMPPCPPDSGTPTVQTVYIHHMEARDRSSGEMGGREVCSPHGAL